MYRTCIAVVDAARARLFILERRTEGGDLHEEISEQRDLVNPARRQRPGELFSESRPGLGRTGTLQYGLDDHRDAHMAELDTEFARAIVDALATLLRDTGARRLILCASPRMLGELRQLGQGLRSHELALDEVPRDLVKLSPTELRAQLVSYGLLPVAPPRPGLAREL